MQLSYKKQQAPAFVGQLDGSGPYNARSYAAEARISIGAAVRLGTNPEDQVLPATSGAGVIGFSIREQSVTQKADGFIGYDIGDSLAVVTVGRLWVETEDAVTAGNVANLVLSSGKLTDAAVGVGVETLSQISVRFVSSTTAAGLALVEVK